MPSPEYKVPLRYYTGGTLYLFHTAQTKKNRSICGFDFEWCTRQDLNLHGSLHTPLKRTCLPFHHWCVLKYYIHDVRIRQRLVIIFL